MSDMQLRSLDDIEVDFNRIVFNIRKSEEPFLDVVHKDLAALYAELSLKKAKYYEHIAEYRQAKKVAIDGVMSHYADSPSGKPEAVSRLELMIEERVDSVMFKNYTCACAALETAESLQEGITMLLDFISPQDNAKGE